MRRLITLAGLEWKRALKALPLMLAEAVVMCIFLGGILFLCQKLFYGEAVLQKIPIGIVTEEENGMTELALTYLEGMESTSAACEFRRMTEEEGRKALARGEVAALMILPQEMMEAILDSRNYPVRVYFPEHSSLGALLIKELTDAGAGMLSMAQAEVYAAYEMNLNFDNIAELKELEQKINLTNMRFAMARERMLDQETLQISEEIPLMLHYLASGVTLFLMLWGIACGRFLKGDSRTFGRQLRRAGVRSWQWLLIKLTGVLLVLGAGAGGMLALTALLRPFLTEMGLETGLNPSLLPYAAGLLVCIAALLLFCYQAAPGRSSGMALVFIITIVIIFISGGFIPAAFLPESLNRLADGLPGRAMIQTTAALLGADAGPAGMQRNLLQLAGWSGGFFAAAWLIYVRKGETEV